MSKNKLDKGDQQLEMVGHYIMAFFKGVAAGTKRIMKEQDKMLLFVVITLISGVIFYLRHQIADYFVPETGIHVLKIAMLLSPVFPLLLLYVLGSQKAENPDEFEAKFSSIKFCGKDGKYPVLKNKEVDGKKVIYTFYSQGITLQEWQNRELELENALDCNILNIKTANDSKQIIKLHIVPADQGISDNLPWDDSYIRDKDFSLCIGKGILEDVDIDLNKYPHALIAGVTGSGKSVILRTMLWQCIKKGAKIYMVDFKGGVEFGLDYEKFGEVVTEHQQALALMKELTKEMKMRLKLFRECNVKKLSEYNAMHKDNPLCRIILVCDEVSEMLDKTGLAKQDQTIFYEIEKEMSSLARLARAPGINMLLATQRPDAKVIPGQIKNNLPIRISGRMVDDQASKMVLGNTKASQLGDTLGRFMYTVGADTYEFQAFKFDDDSLVYGDYQIGTMLIDQGYPEDEENDLLDYEPDLDDEDFGQLQGF